MTLPGLDKGLVGIRRNAGVLHRNAITAVDKLSMGSLTVTDSNVVAGNLTAVAHSVAVVANTAQGPTTTATGSLTPTVNECIRIAWAAVANALSYDTFCSITSVNANGLWVGRVTAAQHAAGAQITVVGTIAAGGAAGAVDVGIVGTGLASNVPPFAVNNAYTPAAVTSINCDGFNKAYLHVKLAVTDLRSLPELAIIPFFANKLSSADWHPGDRIEVPILTALGEPLCKEYEIELNGSTGLVVLIDTIVGQGAAASIWVELSP